MIKKNLYVGGTLIKGLFILFLFGGFTNPSGEGFSFPKAILSKEKEKTIISYLSDYMQITYKHGLFQSFLFISYKQQKMYHIVNGRVARVYIISASKYGVGSGVGTGKTPLGLHEIIDKFGYEVPIGGLIKCRSYTGKVVKIYDDDATVPDCVLTRILWLKGVERCINTGSIGDTYKRTIYIHGTPEEGKIGKPASKGCIRMCNVDVAELFDYAYIGMKVLILKE